MSLVGRTILITRAARQSSGLMKAIQERGGKAVAIATIEILPPLSWEQCDTAIGGLYMYDGVIFTSANGAEFFLNRVKELGAEPSVTMPNTIIAVGEKTKQHIERFGLHVTMMPEKFTAADLATKLEQEDLQGKTFLHPRGNLGSNIIADTLRLLGASVDSVIVYRTVKPEGQHARELRSLILGGSIHAATFTSPSTFRNFIDLFSASETEQLRGYVRLAAIGPVTAQAIRSLGFPVSIQAEDSTIEGLVEALDTYFSHDDADVTGKGIS